LFFLVTMTMRSAVSLPAVVAVVALLSLAVAAAAQQVPANQAPAPASSVAPAPLSEADEMMSLMQEEEKSLALTQHRMAQEIQESRRRLQEASKHSLHNKDLPADVIRFRLEADRLESKRKRLMDQMQANADMLMKLNENEDIDGTSRAARSSQKIRSRRPSARRRSRARSDEDESRAERRHAAQVRADVEAMNEGAEDNQEDQDHEREHEQEREGASDPALVQVYEDEIIDIDPAHDRIYEATPRPDEQRQIQNQNRNRATAPEGEEEEDTRASRRSRSQPLRHNGGAMPLPRQLSFSIGAAGFLDCSCQVRATSASCSDSKPAAPRDRSSSEEDTDHAASKLNSTALPRLSDSVAEAHKVLGAADKSAPWIAGSADGSVPPVMGLHCYEACQEHKCRRAYRREGFDAFHDCLLTCVHKCYHGDQAAIKLAEAAVHHQDQVNDQVKRNLAENTLH
jgi:hypothetical protein